MTTINLVIVPTRKILIIHHHHHPNCGHLSYNNAVFTAKVMTVMNIISQDPPGWAVKV